MGATVIGRVWEYGSCDRDGRGIGGRDSAARRLTGSDKDDRVAAARAAARVACRADLDRKNWIAEGDCERIRV